MIDECTKLMLRRGKVKASDGIKLPQFGKRNKFIGRYEFEAAMNNCGFWRLIGLSTKK